MQFILAPECIQKFDNLRKAYEAAKQINLNEKPSMIGMPLFFGGTDVANRNKQVSFLEKIKAILKIHLLQEADLKTPEQQQAYIIASRFLIAANLYVLHQIGRSKRNSILYQLIEDNLGINAENYLDEEDQETCCLTAERLINTPQAFELANASLKYDKLPPFTEKEWKNFREFVKEMSLKSEANDSFTKFPTISLMQPLFGAAFSYVGATVGVVLAEGASHSSSALSPRMQLTALVGSTLLVFKSGTAGVSLFAPVIATKLLDSFCTISLAHILAKTGGYLGQGVGICVGLPVDATFNLLRSICSLISNYYSKVPQLAAIDGIRIADGTTIIAGLPVQWVHEDKLPTGFTKRIIEITEEGTVHIEGEKQDSTPEPMQIPHHVLEEFKKQFNQVQDKQETSEVSENQTEALSCR